MEEEKNISYKLTYYENNVSVTEHKIQSETNDYLKLITKDGGIIREKRDCSYHKHFRDKVDAYTEGMNYLLNRKTYLQDSLEEVLVSIVDLNNTEL